MITLQHSLATLVSLQGDEKRFKEEIPYVLLPDAVRRYLGPRQYSHFEVSHDGKDVSWVKYPEDIKRMSKESFASAEKHMVAEVKPCVLGEETIVSAFDEHNAHLSPLYYAGVKKHLVQDHIFDEFVRNNIDCSRMYEDKFVFQGQEYDGKGIRKVIADFENYGVYLLSYVIYDSFGITANQEWFDKIVKPQLDSKYSQDLSDGTYGYMKIPEEINKWITEHDWSHLGDGSLAIGDYIKMYQDVIDQMIPVDMERAGKEAKLQAAQDGPGIGE